MIYSFKQNRLLSFFSATGNSKNYSDQSKSLLTNTQPYGTNVEEIINFWNKSMRKQSDA